MKVFHYEVKEELGLHARPAQKLSALAKSCKSTITISNADGQAKLNDIIGAMLLNITKGQRITFEVEGDDEEEIVKKLQECVSEIL